MYKRQPQYHGDGALKITAYGDKLVGDICELNDLNHYIGMARLGEPRVPCGSAELGLGENTVGRIADEMILWLPSAIISAGVVLLAMLTSRPVSYTHLRAHETVLDLVCRLLLEKKQHNT